MRRKNYQKPKISDFALDVENLQERCAILKDGLQDFLDQNALHLSEANFERAFQHLLSSTIHHETLTLYDITNYLQKLLEEQEYVIEAMNKTGLAEESLIRLIVTADHRSGKQNIKQAEHMPQNNQTVIRTVKALLAGFLICGFAVMLFKPSFLYLGAFQGGTFQTIEPVKDHYNEIGLSSINELKSLVKELVTLEQAAGNTISAARVWNDVKQLKSVTHHGYKSSYKNFSPAQYHAAKIFLQNRIARFKEVSR